MLDTVFGDFTLLVRRLYKPSTPKIQDSRYSYIGHEASLHFISWPRRPTVLLSRKLYRNSVLEIKQCFDYLAVSCT